MTHNVRYSSAVVHPLVDPQALQPRDEVIDTSVQVHNVREIEEELEHPVEGGGSGAALQQVVELEQDVHLTHKNDDDEYIEQGKG